LEETMDLLIACVLARRPAEAGRHICCRQRDVFVNSREQA
jgi:hypothetical protein